MGRQSYLLMEKSFHLKNLVILFLLCLACSGCGQDTPSSSSNLSYSSAQKAGSPSVVTDQIKFLHMNTLTSGWALTSNNEVVHTVDGGNTWQKVLTRTTLNQEQLFPESLQPGFFPDTATAWIVSGITDKGGLPQFTGIFIYHTTDAGQHWQKTALKNFADCLDRQPAGLTLTFSDLQHGWLLCHLTAGAGSEGKHLFRTKDGGQTWTKVDALTVRVPGYATGLTFSNPLNGWMTIFEGASSCLSWYVTHDGGDTWNEQALPKLCTTNEEPVTGYPGVFFDQQHGVIPVDIVSGTSPHFHYTAYMYVTSNGGQTWRQLPAVSAVATTANYSDAEHAWIVSSDGKNLYSTSDGGQHWQLRGKNPGGIVLDFVTAQTGWLVGETNLFKTTDGGQSWAPQAYSLQG